jgi:intracellular sulfur oxidation DsrE/DsrF family protein
VTDSQRSCFGAVFFAWFSVKIWKSHLLTYGEVFMSVAKMGLYWSLSTILLINSVAYAEESVFDTGWKPGKKDLYSQGNKIVVHMNLLPTDDQLRKMVRSFQHIHEADKKADIKVIVHGPALELFKTASLSEDNRKLINKARSLGVQFLICNNFLESRVCWDMVKIDEVGLWPWGVSFVL